MLPSGGSDVLEDDTLVLQRALSLYSLFRLHNGIRYRQFPPSEFAGAYNRFLREGAR